MNTSTAAGRRMGIATAMRHRPTLLALGLLIASPAVADTTAWLHDISVRVALKSRVKHYAQQLPWPKTQAMPEYPAQWREAGVTGEARLRFTVSASGEIEGLRVVDASQKEFGEAAAAAALKKRS